MHNVVELSSVALPRLQMQVELRQSRVASLQQNASSRKNTPCDTAAVLSPKKFAVCVGSIVTHHRTLASSPSARALPATPATMEADRLPTGN